MTGPRLDDIDRALQEIRAKPAQTGDMDAALAEIRAGGKRDFHDEYKRGLLGPRMARENANERDALENPLSAAVGAVAKHGATVAQGIPGMERAQAYIGSKVSGNDYKTSLADLRGETEQIHPGIRFAEKLVGGLPLGALIPGGSAKTLAQAVKTGAKAGASFGAADAALDADEMSLGDRAIGTGIGAGVGAVAGGAIGGAAKGVQKGVELNSLRKRVSNAPTGGRVAVDTDDAIKAADQWNYGAAELEGELNGGTSPAIQKVLNRPAIKKYANMIRAEEEVPMTDAELVQATARRMSEAKLGHEGSQERLGFSDKRASQIRKIGRELKILTEATGRASEKPPITLDIAGETHSVAPKITPGREAMSGPVESGPLASRTTAPSDPTLRQALRDFPESSLPPKMQGPSGPAFQLRGQPDKVRPGVEIGAPEGGYEPRSAAHSGNVENTPKMRIQTAPAEEVPPVMPSFGHARAEKARMEGERDVFNESADAARRVMRQPSMKADRWLDESSEAFERDIKKMSPEEAREGTKGALARAKEEVKIKPQITAWKAITELKEPIARLNRISPFIDDLDRQAGNAPRQLMEVERILKLMGLANAPLANRP